MAVLRQRGAAWHKGQPVSLLAADFGDNVHGDLRNLPLFAGIQNKTSEPTCHTGARRVGGGGGIGVVPFARVPSMALTIGCTEMLFRLLPVPVSGVSTKVCMRIGESPRPASSMTS